MGPLIMCISRVYVEGNMSVMKGIEDAADNGVESDIFVMYCNYFVHIAVLVGLLAYEMLRPVVQQVRLLV